MADKVGIGILGCGRVVSGPYRPVLEALLAKQQIEVTLACDLLPERQEFMHEAFGAQRFTTDPVEVIHSDAVDLVLVLTPPGEHARLVLAALEAGKHVLVEKPPALSLEEGRRLVETSHRVQRHLVCAPFVTLSPTFQGMCRRLRQGDIGKVLSARAIYGWAGPDWGKWFYRPGGGGPLFDLGVYNLTTLTGFLGPARRVMAMAGIAIPQRIVDGEPTRVEIEDNMHLLLDFGDSVMAVVTTGFTIQQLRCPAIELYGSTGTMQMLGADWMPDGYELWQNPVGAWRLAGESEPNWHYADGLRHAVECILTDATPILTPEHALHVLEIMLKAQVAGREGKAQYLETTFVPPTFA